jgi:hypothetical protein
MSHPREAAFPTPPSQLWPAQCGLTKREYFAGQALRGLTATTIYFDDRAALDPNLKPAQALVRDAVTLADALLAELEARK